MLKNIAKYINNLLSKAVSTTISLGKFGIIVILLLVMWLSYMIFHESPLIKTSLDKWYENSENFPTEADIIECPSIVKAGEIVGNIYKAMMNGGDITKEVEILCDNTSCNFAGQAKQITGAIAMKNKLQNILNKSNEKVSMKNAISLSQRVIIIHKNENISNEIKYKNDIMHVVYKIITALDQVDYNVAITLINLMESSPAWEDFAYKTEINEIKMEVELTIQILELLK